MDVRWRYYLSRHIVDSQKEKKKKKKKEELGNYKSQETPSFSVL